MDCHAWLSSQGGLVAGWQYINTTYKNAIDRPQERHSRIRQRRKKRLSYSVVIWPGTSVDLALFTLVKWPLAQIRYADYFTGFTPLNLSEAKPSNWGRRQKSSSSIHPVKYLQKQIRRSLFHRASLYPLSHLAAKPPSVKHRVFDTFLYAAQRRRAAAFLHIVALRVKVSMIQYPYGNEGQHKEAYRINISIP